MCAESLTSISRDMALTANDIQASSRGTGHEHMSEGYQVRANADESFWFIFDPTDRLMGTCSSRENALQLAALFNKRQPPYGAQKSEQRSPGADTRPVPDQAVSAMPAPAAGESERIVRPIAQSAALFEWYAPPRHSAAWALWERCYRYVRNRGRQR